MKIRLVFWTSVIVGTTLVVYVSVVIASLVIFLQTLPKYDATVAPRRSSMLIPFVSKSGDIARFAGKFVTPLLTEIPKMVMGNASMFSGGTTEEGRMNFTQLAYKHGLACEEHEVQTEDGYVLQLFRVKGGRGGPVLVVHGFLDSADTFVLRGAGSLVAGLVAEGRDVWLPNLRGNKYSRKHVVLNPDTDPTFWNFSFHEFGIYDLPAVIDYVLRRTARDRLQAIAFSHGSTAFFTMGSTRPEYNDKVSLLVALAPVCHMDNIKPPLSDLVVAEAFINFLLKSMGKEEIFGSYSQSKTVLQKMCSYGFLGRELCLEGGFFYLFGKDEEEVKPDFLPLLFGHFPAGTSLKNMDHFAQLNLKGSFSQYDHGLVSNLFTYHSMHPPKYDLSKMTMKIALFVARNDEVSTLKDTELLKLELPNVVEYWVVNRNKFNHIDFVWGENMNTYLFPRLFEVLSKYY